MVSEAFLDLKLQVVGGGRGHPQVSPTVAGPLQSETGGLEVFQSVARLGEQVKWRRDESQLKGDGETPLWRPLQTRTGLFGSVCRRIQDLVSEHDLEILGNFQ